MGITVAVILLLVFIAHAFDRTFSVEVQSKEHEFKDGCSTTTSIICEQELVLMGVCFTRANDSSDTAVYGTCPYVTLSGKDISTQWRFGGLYYHINFTISQLTEQTCGALNRKGLLCSECYDGYGPAVYAFANECIKCHGSAFDRWALYLLVVLFPITVFYVIVIVFNIRATSPPFAAYVLFCQMFAMLDRLYFPGNLSIEFFIHDSSQLVLLLASTLSGIWNLDFGRYIFPPFCVSESINTYHALFLDYISGFYPMILIFFTCVLIELHSSNFKLIVLLWKPFHKCFVRVRRSWDPKASMINAFATFLLLSFSKILFVSCFSKQHTIITISSGAPYRHYALFYDPSIDERSHENLPFSALGFFLSTVFVIIPLMFLCCYQFVRKASICCCFTKTHLLSMFLDTFQGHYKDGTNGTYDCRFLAGLYPLLRVAIIYTFRKHYMLSSRAHLNQALGCFIVTVLVAFVRPYKRFVHNLTETLLLILMSYMVWNASAFQRISYSHKDRINIAVLQLIPHSFLALVIAFKVVKLLFQKLKSTCLSKYRCVNILTEQLSLLYYGAWIKLNRIISNDEELSSITTDIPTQAYYGTMN